MTEALKGYMDEVADALDLADAAADANFRWRRLAQAVRDLAAAVELLCREVPGYQDRSTTLEPLPFSVPPGEKT